MHVGESKHHRILPNLVRMDSILLFISSGLKAILFTYKPYFCDLMPCLATIFVQLQCSRVVTIFLGHHLTLPNYFCLNTYTGTDCQLYCTQFCCYKFVQMHNVFFYLRLQQIRSYVCVNWLEVCLCTHLGDLRVCQND